MVTPGAFQGQAPPLGLLTIATAHSAPSLGLKSFEGRVTVSGYHKLLVAKAFKKWSIFLSVIIDTVCGLSFLLTAV